MPINAAIYISDPSVLGSHVFGRIEGVESHEGLSDGEGATGVRFELPWGPVTMSFMPEGYMAEHLNGFEGYARGVIKNKRALAYTLGRIGMVRMCLGCNIEHADSDSDAVHDFLFAFNGAVNGLLFLYDSIYDFSGEPLGGPAADLIDEGEDTFHRHIPAARDTEHKFTGKWVGEYVSGADPGYEKTTLELRELKDGRIVGLWTEGGWDGTEIQGTRAKNKMVFSYSYDHNTYGECKGEATGELSSDGKSMDFYVVETGEYESGVTSTSEWRAILTKKGGPPVLVRRR